MWNGSFDPLQKVRLDVSFDPDNTDNPDDMPPEEVEGVITVLLGGKFYKWNVTYDEYLNFEKAGFTRSYLNAHFPINYVGDWGWPYGRDRGSVGGMDTKNGTIFYTKKP